MTFFHQRSAVAGTFSIGSPIHSSPCSPSARPCAAPHDRLAEGLDEAFLLLADVVNPDALRAEFAEFDEPVAQASRVG
ncbi:MAG: hypothetical protein AB7Q42_22615 [Acidimicrobiia bacterium]